MTTLVNSRHKQGVLTMSNPNNYRELTGHTKAKSKSPTVANVPKIGQRIPFDPALVAQDADPETKKLGTPMSKIRYFKVDRAWKQVPRNEAGMLVFFQNPPAPEHKEFVIQSIIPTQTACYADLV